MITTLTKEELLKRIKAAVLSLDPNATVILYGSRARGDAEPDSDWDILVLTEQAVDYALVKTFRYALYDLEFECGEVLCAIVVNREEWKEEIKDLMPFSLNVNREGLVL